MKTELLDIYKIAKKIASMAGGETKENLATEIVKLTISIRTKTPVYVLFNKKEKLIFVTINKSAITCTFNCGFKLAMTIEESKELNIYKITYV